MYVHCKSKCDDYDDDDDDLIFDLYEFLFSSS